jgi:DNA-binding PadR family transcriptional regulator
VTLESVIIKNLGCAPISGADLSKTIARFVPREGMYEALRKLEMNGLIASEWVSGPYPRQCLYRLK